LPANISDNIYIFISISDCHIPNEGGLDVASLGKKDLPPDNGVLFEQRGAPSIANALSASYPLQADGDRDNNDSTTGTSHEDRMDVSNPSFATRLTIDWHQL
jgi:hypothetical protein